MFELQKIKYKRVFFTIIILSTLLLSSFTGFSQKIKIKGMIKDNQDTPLPGVLIIEKGTSYATFSREDGSFEFGVTNKNSSLILSKKKYIQNEYFLSGIDSLTLIMAKEKGKNKNKQEPEAENAERTSGY